MKPIVIPAGVLTVLGLFTACESGPPPASGATGAACYQAAASCLGTSADGAACAPTLQGCVTAALSADAPADAESVCSAVETACLEAGESADVCGALASTCVGLVSGSQPTGEAPPEGLDDPAQADGAPEGAGSEPNGEPSAGEETAELPEGALPGDDALPGGPQALQGDITPPTVAFLDVPAQVAAGDTLTFSWVASDASGLAEGGANAFIGGPSGWTTTWCGFAIPGVPSGTQGDATVFTVSCPVPANAVSQSYSLFVQVQDVVGNTASLSPGDDGVGTFAVLGGAQDAEPPTVAQVSAPARVVPGESFAIEWRVVDPSGIEGSAVWIAGPTGAFGDGNGLLFQYSEVAPASSSVEDASFFVIVQAPETAVAGTYTVWVSALDTLGNKRFEPTDATFVVDCEEGLVQCLAIGKPADVCAAAAQACQGSPAPQDPTPDADPEAPPAPPEGADGSDASPSDGAEGPEASAEDADSGAAPAPATETASKDAETDGAPASGSSAASGVPAAPACLGGYVACTAAAGPTEASACAAAWLACTASAAG